MCGHEEFRETLTPKRESVVCPYTNPSKLNHRTNETRPIYHSYIDHSLSIDHSSHEPAALLALSDNLAISIMSSCPPSIFSASAPVSPVRMRTMSATGETKILPSPISPVAAA